MVIITAQDYMLIFGVTVGGNKVDIVETKKRTVVRMITYRLTAWLFTIFWTWLIMGDLAKSTGFATVLHLLLSIDYYIHERIWLKIKWGFKHCDCSID